MKPMIFSNDTAFEQLRDNGVVTTFRKQEREKDAVWIRRTRTGAKKFDAEILSTFRVNPARIADIRPYTDRSGFEDAEAWVEVIREIHSDLGPGYVHWVQRKDWNECEMCGHFGPDTQPYTTNPPEFLWLCENCAEPSQFDEGDTQC